MYKVTIQRPRELETVGYYKTKTEAVQVQQQITVYAKHNYKVSVVEFSEDELFKSKKSDSLIGIWL